MLTAVWAGPEMENTSDLRLYLHLSNSRTNWCLLWCTEVQLDCLSFATALYCPKEQFCLSEVAGTAYAILLQLCLTARHTPSS